MKQLFCVLGLGLVLISPARAEEKKPLSQQYLRAEGFGQFVGGVVAIPTVAVGAATIIDSADEDYRKVLVDTKGKKALRVSKRLAGAALGIGGLGLAVGVALDGYSQALVNASADEPYYGVLSRTIHNPKNPKSDADSKSESEALAVN